MLKVNCSQRLTQPSQSSQRVCSPLPASSSGRWWGHSLFHFGEGKWGCLEDTLKSLVHKSTQALNNVCTLMPLLWCGFEMLIWRFPYCCLPPVGGVGVNCNAWGWTLVRVHWGLGQGQRRPPDRLFFVNDLSFQAPSCGGASSWLVKECKKRNPGMQVPLLMLLFGVAHILLRLWRSYSCWGVCVGLLLIHRSSFTFWETWGWASNWHQAFFVNECGAQHPAGLSLRCL